MVSAETKVEGSFSITKDSFKEATSQKIALRILKNIETFKQFVIDADLISFDDFQENVNQILDILSAHKQLQLIFVFAQNDKLDKVAD